MALPAIIAGAMRTAALAEIGGGGGAAGAAGAFGGGGAANLSLTLAPRIQVLSQVFNQFQKNIQPEKAKSFGDSLKDINQQLLAARYNLRSFTTLIHSMPERFVAAATFAVDTLSHIARPFVALAARNNPAVVKQFELAQNDAYGVLGRMVIPVVQAFTRQMRSLGDTMAGLEPVMRPAIAAVAQFVDVSGKQFTDAIKANAALFDTLGVALAFVAHEATSTVRVIGTMAKLFGFINGFNTGSNFDPNRTSMGAGIRTSRQIGQPEELQNELIKNALIAGAGPGGTKEERQVNYLMNIDKTLGFIWRAISQFVLTGPGMLKDMQESKLGRIPGINETAQITSYILARTS